MCVRGSGSPNSDEWRKGLALCLLSGSNPIIHFTEINPTLVMLTKLFFANTFYFLIWPKYQPPGTLTSIE
jgi:hypothetical protein